MQLLSFRKPYEMLPPVPEEQMLTHGFAYKGWYICARHWLR
jgi:hypothetical protein